MMDFLKLAHERYSCRSLTDRPVEPEKVEKIIEAGMVALTACNNQPVMIWTLESEEALKKARTACRQGFAQAAPVIFVVGAATGEAWEREFDGKNFADVDAAIVATHMMLEVQALGLGTTWVGHFDVNRMAALFPEMAGYSLIAMFPVGYPAPDAAPGRGHALSKTTGEMVHRL